MSTVEDIPALIFTVPGKPIGQGSKSRSRNGHMYEDSSKTLKPWREAVTWAAIDAIRNSEHREAFPLQGPVWLHLTFKIARPKGHYGTGRNAGALKANAPFYVTSKPDWDKAARAVGDSLTVAGVYRDDALVASATVTKVYAETPSVQVHVSAALADEWAGAS